MYLYLPPAPHHHHHHHHHLSHFLSSLSLSLFLSLRFPSPWKTETETETMRQSSESHLLVFLFLFLFLLFSNSIAAARLLTAKQGEEKVKVDEIVQRGPLRTEEADDSWNNLMGMEDCGSGDEECLNRRMVAEAHLDYIYTQHHKP